MLVRTVFPALVALAPLSVSAGTSTLFASGEDLATEGVNAPRLSRDGWALQFSHITATFDQITAWQTAPPFMADGEEISGMPLRIGGPFTVDPVDADARDRVAVTMRDAVPGHYNALSRALVPGADGYSPVLDGVARKNGQVVPSTLRTSDSVAHVCGECPGDVRKGFVTADAGSGLEITLHPDHRFGRADRADDAESNLSAAGFDRFAAGGMHGIARDWLHPDHLGEGHCHVASL